MPEMVMEFMKYIGRRTAVIPKNVLDNILASGLYLELGLDRTEELVKKNYHSTRDILSFCITSEREAKRLYKKLLNFFQNQI